LQDPKNRQNSIEFDNSSEIHEEWKMKQLDVISATMDSYRW